MSTIKKNVSLHLALYKFNYRIAMIVKCSISAGCSRPVHGSIKTPVAVVLPAHSATPGHEGVGVDPLSSLGLLGGLGWTTLQRSVLEVLFEVVGVKRFAQRQLLGVADPCFERGNIKMHKTFAWNSPV